MKVKLNLTNQTLEYIDNKPFIQGNDDRNKILAYVSENITDIQIAYQLQNGKTTFKMINDYAVSPSDEDYITGYTGYAFKAPQVLTNHAGDFIAAIIVSYQNKVFKFNVVNTVISSVDIDLLNSLFENEQVVLDYLDSMSTTITSYGSRITYLEGKDITNSATIGEHDTKLEMLNTEVFGDSTGATSDNTNGLHYIVRTNYAGRIATLESSSAADGNNIAILNSHMIGFLALSGNSGNLTSADLAEIEKNNCFILLGGNLYSKNVKKVSNNNTIYEFEHIEVDEVQAQPDKAEIKHYIITIDSSLLTYSVQLLTEIVLTPDSIVNATNSTDTSKVLSAAKGKAIYDELIELKNYIYNGTSDDVINRLKDVFDFLAGVDDDETLLNLINQKADKSTTYTKTQTDTLLAAKANANNVYTVSQVNSLLDTKYNKTETYSKSETNALLNTKANATDVYNKTQTYNKGEISDILDSLVVDGYEMPYERMLAIFNDAYGNDPLVVALNSLNGEVI